MNSVDCSFVVRDLGDTQIASEVAQGMLLRGKRVRILALGQAAYDRLKQDKGLKDVVVSPDAFEGVRSALGSEPHELGGGQGHRVDFASPDDAHILAKALSAPVVVTGVVARTQAAIVHALRDAERAEKRRHIIGIYDSLALNKNCFLFVNEEKSSSLTPPDKKAAASQLASNIGAAPSFSTQLDEIWVPLAGLVVGVAAAAHVPEARVIPMGHPATEKTLAQLAALEQYRSSIREDKLGVKQEDQVVFYAGGRDAPGQTAYAQSFETFVRAALGAAAPSRGKRIFVAGLHPVSDGQLERGILEKLNASTLVRLIRTVSNPVVRQELSTDELVIACDVLATFNSTVASQAALMPRHPTYRRVIFIDGGPNADAFAVVQQGLATQTMETGKVIGFLEHGFCSDAEAMNKNTIVPPEQHSTKRMIERLDMYMH